MLATIDKRQLVLVKGVVHQLHTNLGEDDRQTDTQVLESLHQSA